MKKLLPFVFLFGACVPAKECRERAEDARAAAWTQCQELNADMAFELKAKTDLLRKFNLVNSEGKLNTK